MIIPFTWGRVGNAASAVINDSGVPGASVADALDQLGSSNAAVLPPNNGGSFMVTTTTGVAELAIPAPPAGFLTLLFYAGCSNTDAVAGTPQLFAGAAPLTAAVSLLAGEDNPNLLFVNSPQEAAMSVLTDQAINVRRVAGTSVSMQFRGSYCRVPTGTIALGSVVLTAAFQPIASLIPPTSQASRPWQNGLILGADSATEAVWTLLNLDNIPHSVVWKITRGVRVFTWTVLGAVDNGRQIISAGFTLLAGDILEAKTAEAINVPGSVTLTGVHEFVPLI